MSYVLSAPERYFCRTQRFILSGGERFATVVDFDGVPSYYPTALAISRRSRSISSETLATQAADLIHIGIWAGREKIDINVLVGDHDAFKAAIESAPRSLERTVGLAERVRGALND